MLRYAAKAVLSKTLQTFLRKYVVDIEFESLAMPSLLGDYYYENDKSGAGGGGSGSSGSGSGGSSSGGWGVKLSNVKLREGVVLMTLPGRRKRKIKKKVKRTGRRRRRRKNKDEHHGGKEEVQSLTAGRRESLQRETEDRNQKQKQDAPPLSPVLAEPAVSAASVSSNPQRVIPDAPPPPLTQTTQNYHSSTIGASPNPFTRYPPPPSTTTASLSTAAVTTTTATTTTVPNAENTTLGHDANNNQNENHTYYYSDYESSSSLSPPTSPMCYRSKMQLSRSKKSTTTLSMPATTTTTKTTKSSMFCFVRSNRRGVADKMTTTTTTTKKKTNDRSVVKEDETKVDSLNDGKGYDDAQKKDGGTSNDEDGVRSSGKATINDVGVVVFPDASNRMSNPYDSHGEGKVEGVHNDDEEHVDFEELVLQHDDDDENDTADDDNEEDEDEEEFVEVEEEMILRVGAGGRVGMLDVRLVGKELHVSVEDAYLVVEAAPKEGSDKREDDSGKGTSSSSGSTSSPSKKQQTGGDKNGESQREGKKGTEKDSKISSERDSVMKRSGLASSLASVPHLFLRDCRVRLIVKGELFNEEDDVSVGQSTTVNVKASNGDELSKSESNEHLESSDTDTVVELGIDFLSVTNGEDFLAYMRSDPTTSASEMKFSRVNSAPVPASTGDVLTSNTSAAPSRRHEHVERNEYLRKRIRTGKGPEGGVWVKIFPSCRRKHSIREKNFLEMSDTNQHAARHHLRWAHHSWMASTEMCLFRCSGLDLQARIYLGEKQKTSREEEDQVMWGDEYDGYTLDSMLYGVDYVAPGSTFDVMSESDTDEVHGELPDAESNADEMGPVDKNGIERVEIRSIFHRVARGLCPLSCPSEHSPSEDCPLCWKDPQCPDDERTSASIHSLDSSMPLPGLLVHLSVVDPIEVNVNRENLEMLGVLRTLFSRNEVDSGASHTQEKDLDATSYSDDPSKSENDSAKPDSCIQTTDTSVSSPSTNGDAAKLSDSFVNLDEAFPAFMRPEEIQVMGVHMATFVFRLHIMRGRGKQDTGYSFCFWELKLKSLTVELQQLLAEELSFDDVRCEIGHLEVNEMRGVLRKRILSLGGESSLSEDTGQWRDVPGRLWPCASSVMLGVPIPFETWEFESRQKHAVLLRLIQLPSPGSLDEFGFIHIKVGVIEFNVPSTVMDEVSIAVSEGRRSIFGVDDSFSSSGALGKAAESPSVAQTKSSNPKSTSWNYKVQFDGGTCVLDPIVRCSFPPTHLMGKKSSSAGVLVHTILNCVDLEYGIRQPPPTCSVFPITQLAALPDCVRMRILLFLDDLTPLARALNMKKASDPLMLCRAVNKRLAKICSSEAKREARHRAQRVRAQEKRSSRRREILSRLMSLDDRSLEELMVLHEKKAKKNAGSGRKKGKKAKK